MIVLKATQDQVLAVLQAVSGICERRHTLPVLASISNGFPEQGGGGAAALKHAPVAGLTAAEAEASDCSGGEGAPEVAASDDDDGDGDGDPDSDRRRPRSKTPAPQTLTPPAALFPIAHTAHYVAVGRSRIYQLAAAGEFPQPIKVGRSVRWIRAELDAWIAAQAARREVGVAA